MSKHRLKPFRCGSCGKRVVRKIAAEHFTPHEFRCYLENPDKIPEMPTGHRVSYDAFLKSYFRAKLKEWE